PLPKKLTLGNLVHGDGHSHLANVSERESALGARQRAGPRPGQHRKRNQTSQGRSDSGPLATRSKHRRQQENKRHGKVKRLCEVGQSEHKSESQKKDCASTHTPDLEN